MTSPQPYLRVIYLCSSSVAALLKNQFSLWAEADRLQVTFCYDAVAAVQLITGQCADLVVVDERELDVEMAQEGLFEVQEDVRGPVLVAQNTAGLTGAAGPASGLPRAPTVEVFRKSLKSFLPKDLHFPLRRVLVVTLPAVFSSQRQFELGRANVRGILQTQGSPHHIYQFLLQHVKEIRSVAIKTSVCVSGGGLEGFLYGLGVLQALDLCFQNRTCLDFDIYCGVSSGSLAASTLAAGIPAPELVNMIYRRKGRFDPVHAGIIYDFASAEMIKRVWTLLQSLSVFDPVALVEKLQSLVPIGFFKGEKLKAFLEKQFKKLNVTDNFHALEKELYVSVTDQDSGEHVVFGEEPWKDIRVTQAVRASCALPPFYLPEKINGHWFTDGQLTSSSDFMTAVRKGARLVVLIDPMVPYTSHESGSVMARGGLFSAIQAVKSLVQTRAVAMVKHAMDVNPDVDFVLFQPTGEAMEAMAGNPMHYRIRTEIVEIACRETILHILRDYVGLSHQFLKAGFVLKSPEELQEQLGRLAP